jgi:exosortase/archaeosortase family protein
MTSIQSRWLPLAFVCAATWPVWHWFVIRTTDGSDEPLGLLALATLLIFAARNARQPFRGDRALLLPAVALAIYAISFHFVPPLVRAMCAISAIGTLLFRGRGVMSLWGLAALSLPIVATFQFYFGFPLRVIAAAACAEVLRTCGLAVVHEGTVLRYAGETIMVDAPCSGVRMLWFGLYLMCALAAFYQLDAERTLIGCVVAMPIVITANIARATVLFFKEAHIVLWAEWTHAAVGMILFAGAASLMAMLARRLQMKPCVA